MSTNTTTGNDLAASGLALSFLGCVNIAVNLVSQRYPGANLYEVDTQTTNPGQPSPLKYLRAVFQVKGGTAIALMTQWGEFGPIQFIAQPWLEDVVIPWPITMDIVEADGLLKKAGYTGPYGAVTLRHPLYPGSYEPYYIFSMMSGEYLFVGVNDSKVSEPQTGPAVHEPA